MQEFSHHVSVTQKLGGLEKATTGRELRWKGVVKAIERSTAAASLPNISTKDVKALHPLVLGSFVIARTNMRMYIGEVLDLYKKGNHRHGSVLSTNNIAKLSYLSLRVYRALDAAHDDSTTSSDEDSSPEHSAVPIFSRTFKAYELHTHAFTEQVLYHVGKKPFASQVGAHFILDGVTAARWNALARPSVKRVILKLPAVGKGLSKKPVKN